MVKVVGEKPRPRALILGFKSDTAELQKHFASHRVISSLAEVRQEEFDLLLVAGDGRHSVAPHLFVIALGHVNCGLPEDRSDFTFRGATAAYVSFGDDSVATEFLIADWMTGRLRRLAEDDLLPCVVGRARNPVIAELVRVRGGLNVGNDKPKAVRPFISTRDGHALAGSFVRRAQPPSHYWLLPFGVDLGAWIDVALEEWHGLAPDRFPLVEWRYSEPWLTPEERKFVAEVEKAEFDKRNAIAAFEAIEAKARRDLQSARTEADAKARRLLTAQASELVEAVAQALAELGFEVEDMDKVHPENDRREDLRVRDPRDPEWVALVEVRGYKGGAQLNDLLRIQRFQNRYTSEMKGVAATRLWYVVNQFIERDPAKRPQVLNGNADELQTFSDAGGLAFDTRDLFSAWRDVRSGACPARTILETMKGTGRWPVET